MSRAVAVTVSSSCAVQWPITEPARAPAIASPSRSSVSSIPSVHNEQPRALVGVRAMLAVVVRHLIAHAGRQLERAPVLQVRHQLAVDAENDVALGAPVIGDVTRRIVDEAHPDVAELPGPPGGNAGVALV